MSCRHITFVLALLLALPASAKPFLEITAHCGPAHSRTLRVDRSGVARLITNDAVRKVKISKAGMRAIGERIAELPPSESRGYLSAAAPGLQELVVKGEVRGVAYVLCGPRTEWNARWHTPHLEALIREALRAAGAPDFFGGCNCLE